MHKPTYTKPELNGHQVLYAGRRYYVFEVSNNYPYEDCETHCDLVIFDKSDELCNGVVAWCKKMPDGGFECETPLGQAIYQFSADSIADLVKVYIKVEKDIQKNYF